MKYEANRTRKKYTESFVSVHSRANHKPGCRSLKELAEELDVPTRNLQLLVARAKTKPPIRFIGGKNGSTPYYEHDVFMTWVQDLMPNAKVSRSAPLLAQVGSTDGLAGTEE